MSTDTNLIMRVHESLSRTGRTNLGWRVALPLTVAVIVSILAAYWRTAESIVAIWWRSETFAHGFLIVPISVVLIWMKRREVARLAPEADYLGLVLLAGAGLAWLVAAAGQVQVVQQYALTAMIPAAVVAVAGRRVALALAFPLAFLLFGVPVGEVLIPPLMNWTAHFTVAAIRLSGIPVFSEGTFFTIPSGTWSVVEGCSGLRYLIASITVGTLYAYLSYQSFWKRALFVVLSVIVPIIANGLRAYMIVMIADLSDMRLALGFDHLIYGWVFFGFVIFLLFWLGSFWRDPAPDASRDEGTALLSAQPPSRARMAGSAIVAVAIAAAWPLWAAHLDRAGAASGTPILASPAGVSGWVIDAAPLTDWRPRYRGASASLFDVYRKGDRAVALYLGYYRHQHRGAELITTTNVMVVQKDPVWGNIGDSKRMEDLGQGQVVIRQTRLRSAGQRLLIWDWFRISGRDLSNPYLAKLILARDRLLGRGDDGAAIILATPYSGDAQHAEKTLREFAAEMLPSIDAALARAKAGSKAAGPRAR
jgi:exosortase A